MDFGKGENGIQFYREQAFTDIDVLYVSDMGETLGLFCKLMMWTFTK